MIEALLLSIALAMDAFAVALAQGARFRPEPRHALVIALTFGIAQGGMAALGWGLGVAALEWIAAFDHWIAFALLSAIGVHMVLAEDGGEASPLLGGTALLTAAFATSVDALAAGVALPTFAVAAPLSIALIASVTLALSLSGVGLGWHLGKRFGRAAEVVGGILMIGLGCKILAEHTGLL